MSIFLISLIMAGGTATWLYVKFGRRSGGGNIGPALIGAGVSGFILFIVLYLTLSTVLNK